MGGLLSRTYGLMRILGVDPIASVRAIRALPSFISELNTLKKQRGNDKTFAFSGAFPELGQRYESAGTMSGHYFHQDLLVARRIFEENPDRHVDIGSRIDGFVAQVSVFREIEVLDIREVQSTVKNIKFKQADLMQPMASMDNYCDSISSLHAIEHFGLGRYGDPIDYNGHIKAFSNIGRILKPGGIFYLSVPIGPLRIDFNSHRVFSIAYVLDMFKDGYFLERFSYVDDKGDLIENVDLKPADITTNLNCIWGCGIFELRKK